MLYAFSTDKNCSATGHFPIRIYGTLFMKNFNALVMYVPLQKNILVVIWLWNFNSINSKLNHNSFIVPPIQYYTLKHRQVGHYHAYIVSLISKNVFLKFSSRRQFIWNLPNGVKLYGNINRANNITCNWKEKK